MPAFVTFDWQTVSLKHDGTDKTDGPDGTVKMAICLSRLCLTDGTEPASTSGDIVVKSVL